MSGSICILGYSWFFLRASQHSLGLSFSRWFHAQGIHNFEKYHASDCARPLNAERRTRNGIAIEPMCGCHWSPVIGLSTVQTIDLDGLARCFY